MSYDARMSTRGGVDLIGRRSDARVLDLARRKGPIDRASLAAQSGLTPQAVTNVLSRLASAGLVERAGTMTGGRGKPSHLYRMREASAQAVGAHVTRRGMRLVRVDLHGTVRSRRSYELPHDFTPDEVLQRLLDGVTGMHAEVERDGGTLHGVGIGMIGPLEQARGIVRDAYQVQHWKDVPLRERAEQVLGTRVSLEKDVIAAVLGEAWDPSTTATDTALLMLDDGVGAGLWLHGAVHRGAHTNAGEFGHTVVELRGPTCVCGRRGCLEAVHRHALSAGDVAAAATVIAVGALNLVESLDVSRVILGGGDFLQHADLYLAAVEAEIRHYRPARSWRSVKTSAAKYGVDFVAVGSGLGILRSQFFDPDRDAAPNGTASLVATAGASS